MHCLKKCMVLLSDFLTVGFTSFTQTRLRIVVGFLLTAEINFIAFSDQILNANTRMWVKAGSNSRIRIEWERRVCTISLVRSGKTKMRRTVNQLMMFTTIRQMRTNSHQLSSQFEPVQIRCEWGRVGGQTQCKRELQFHQLSCSFNPISLIWKLYWNIFLMYTQLQISLNKVIYYIKFIMDYIKRSWVYINL